jgi:SAM-dependent methyltransferase
MVYPILFSQRRLANTLTEVDDIISLLRVSAGARILDLCCGMGRHSLEFARRGFSVTGVDRTPFYLKKAIKSARTEGLNVEFILDDMREFRRTDTFDAVMNLFTSFGYFEDAEDDRQVLKNVFCSLKSGGLLLLEMMGKEVLARIFLERGWREEDGIIILEERKLNRDWSWIDNRWIMLKGDRRKEHRVSHRLYSAAELSSLLHETGFGAIEVFGGLDGSPYDHTARRLIVVAHK